MAKKIILRLWMLQIRGVGPETIGNSSSDICWIFYDGQVFKPFDPVSAKEETKKVYVYKLFKKSSFKLHTYLMRHVPHMDLNCLQIQVFLPLVLAVIIQL